jgi:hypothetical protein
MSLRKNLFRLSEVNQLPMRRHIGHSNGIDAGRAAISDHQPKCACLGAPDPGSHRSPTRAGRTWRRPLEAVAVSRATLDRRCHDNFLRQNDLCCRETQSPRDFKLLSFTMKLIRET